MLPKRRTKAPDPEVVWEPIPGSSQELAIDTRCHHTLYHGARGPGKAVADDTLVLAKRGWIRADEVTMDDHLVSVDGTFTRVVGIFPQDNPQLDFYRVTFDDGATVDCCGNHQWQVTTSSGLRSSGGWFKRTTRQILNAKGRYGIPYLSAAAAGEQWTGFDPYMVGLLLGDGTMGSDYVTLYSMDYEIVAYAERKHGWRIYKYDGSKCYRAVCPRSKKDSHFLRQLMPRVTAEDKAVPVALMTADPASRLALLQGLMDSDGSVEKQGNKCRFVSLSEQLARDVLALVRSLGGRGTCYMEKRESPRGGKNYRWRVNFTARNMFIPFRLTRKWERVETTKRVQNVRYINSIEPIPLRASRCFTVDHPSHLFVIDGFVVTHNTITQLMRFRRRVGLGYGSFWRGVIFDREFKHLADLVAQSKRFFSQFNDGATFHSSGQDYKWVWPTGEELLFRHIKKVSEYDGYHGHEYPFLGWNELTKYPTGELYEKMMSVNRSSFVPEKHTPKDQKGRYKTPDGKPLPDIPLEVFSTTNPNGPGHNWVKRKFIDVAQPGEVVRTSVEVFNPRTQQDEEVVKTQVAIFGSFRENIYLPPEYVAELESITDPNLRRAWLYGDWSVVSGGAFDDLWSDKIHKLPRFTIPKEWVIDRSFDWGSSHPFSVGWWAEANGEEVVLPNGDIFAPAPGSLIQFAEWYGAREIGSNKGLAMSAPDIAQGIIEREIEMMREGWISTQPIPGPADNQIRDVRESDTDTIEAKMLAEGIRWTVSDKSPGSRKNGVQLFRDRLQAALRGEGPGIYFMVNCQASIQLIPSLPRDTKQPDDVDSDAEDHTWDMVRYRILKKAKRLATSLNVRFPL